MIERGNGNEPARLTESILTRDFAETILQRARENLNAHGSLSAAVFARLDQDARIIIPLSLPEDHEEKQLYFAHLGFSIRAEGRTIQEAILVSESWYVEKTEDEIPPQAAPSQHPNRKEAITLVGRDSSGLQFLFAIQPFRRNEQNQPVFEELDLHQFNEGPDQKYYSTGLLDYLFLQNLQWPVLGSIH